MDGVPKAHKGHVSEQKLHRQEGSIRTCLWPTMRQRLTCKNEIVRHTRVSKVSYCVMHGKSIENESKKKFD